MRVIWPGGLLTRVEHPNNTLAQFTLNFVLLENTVLVFSDHSCFRVLEKSTK